MIHIFVAITVSSDKRTEILKLLKALTQASQKENGCLRYQYYLHPTDQTQLIISEQWENAEVLDAHEMSEHFKTLLPQIGNLATSVDIQRF